MWSELPDPADSNSRRLRIRALLGLWQRSPVWRRSDEDPPHRAEDVPFASAEERALWASIVDAGRVWPPRASVRGLQLIIAAARLADGAGSVPAFRAFVESGQLNVRGPRARFRHGALRTWKQLAWGHFWSFVVPLNAFAGAENEVTRVVEASFHQMRAIGGRLIVSHRREPLYRRELALMLAERFLHAPGRGLELVTKAEALGVIGELFDALPGSSRSALADIVRRRVLREATCHDAIDDMVLEGFDQKAAVADLRDARASGRVRELRLTQRYLPEVGLDTEVALELSEALVMGGAAGHVAELLRELPVGQTLYHALWFARDVRPEVLGHLIADRAWRAAAVIAIRGMRPHRNGHRPVPLDVEWRELQRLVLWEAVAADDADARDALDLMESGIDPAERQPGESPQLSRADQLAPWRHALAEDGRASVFVSILVEDLSRRPSDALFAVSLRILGLLQQHDVEARRLAAASVAAYQASMSARQGDERHLTVDQAGETLWDLLLVLRRLDMDAEQERLLRPFTLADYRDLAASIEQDATDATAIRHTLDAVDVVRAHGHNLLSAVEGAPVDADVEKLIAALVELFAAKVASGHLYPAFGWGNSGLRAERTYHQRLGMVLGRSRLVIGHIATIVATRPEVVDLAAMLTGISAGKAAETLRASLEERVDMERKRLGEEVALGEALALGRAFIGCGMPEEAIAFADRAVLLLDRRSLQGGSLRHDALWIRRRALLHAKRLDELLRELPADDNDPDLGCMKALALAAKDEHASARAVLEDVLRRDPYNEIALVNRTATYINERRWAEAASSAAQAREKLKDKVPPNLILSWAVANAELKNWNEAEQALRRLPSEFARSPLGVRLRTHLLLNAAAGTDELRADIVALDRTAPDDARELRTLLSASPLVVEASALYTDGPRPLDFADHCRKIGSDPDAFLESRIFEACEELARHPNLAQRLSEDHRTRVIGWLINDPVAGLVVEVGERGGVAPKTEGVADLTIWGARPHSREHRRALVRGEAKTWNGQQWLLSGLKQALAVGNTGTERFLIELVYCDQADFDHCEQAAFDAIASFRVMEGSKEFFAVTKQPSRRRHGDKVRLIESEHSVRGDDIAIRIVRTFMVDVRSAAERSARTE
jgi:tetratricopeptide (TPR) repeat protein